MVRGCQGTYLFHSKILDLNHDVGLLKLGKADSSVESGLNARRGCISLKQEQVLESVGIWFASRGEERILPLWDSLFYTGSIAAGFISAKLVHWGLFI